MRGIACLAAGPAPSVAQNQHVDVVKRALADVGVYLSGARWEVLHRKAIAEAQLLVRDGGRTQWCNPVHR